MLGGTPVTASSLENAREILRHTEQSKALRDGATASDLLAVGGAPSRPPGSAGDGAAWRRSG